MKREEILKAMQNYIMQLKAMSDRGKFIRDELLKLNQEDAKWYEENLRKWMEDNGLLRQE